MAAQHKREGRTAKLERIRRIKKSNNPEIIVYNPRWWELYDGISPGTCVVVGECR